MTADIKSQLTWCHVQITIQNGMIALAVAAEQIVALKKGQRVLHDAHVQGKSSQQVLRWASQSHRNFAFGFLLTHLVCTENSAVCGFFAFGFSFTLVKSS